MAYSSYGKKVYASIKDLPQYTSIGNGDKIVIWNEARDGAATVDFADLLIDLEHTTFKSTISEVITLASNIQTFIYTVEEEINSIHETLDKMENTVNNELKARIKALEFVIAVMLGANSYWLSSAGLDTLRNKFLIDGINPSNESMEDDADSEEARNTMKWYKGLMSTIQSYIAKMTPGVQNDDILLQTKFTYKWSDIDSAPSSNEMAATLFNTETLIKTVGADGKTSSTTISYQTKTDS